MKKKKKKKTLIEERRKFVAVEHKPNGLEGWGKVGHQRWRTLHAKGGCLDGKTKNPTRTIEKDLGLDA